MARVEEYNGIAGVYSGEDGEVAQRGEEGLASRQA